MFHLSFHCQSVFYFDFHSLEPILLLVKREFEEAIDHCIDYISDVSPLLTSCLEKYDSHQNVEIDLLVVHSILSRQSLRCIGMNYGFLFSHILHNICDTLCDPNPSISIVEHAIYVAQALIPHLLSVISDDNIMFLWKTMWNTTNLSISSILLSFFKSSIPFIDPSFFSPFIQYAIESPNFTSVSYSQWECCCYLWKAVNDIHQFIEMKMPILNMAGFVTAYQNCDV